MVNPDGVFLGNNRCNLIGQDLNRCWNIATEFSHPTILAVKSMLRDIDNSDVSETNVCRNRIKLGTDHKTLTLIFKIALLQQQKNAESQKY